MDRNPGPASSGTMDRHQSEYAAHEMEAVVALVLLLEFSATRKTKCDITHSRICGFDPRHVRTGVRHDLLEQRTTSLLVSPLRSLGVSDEQDAPRPHLDLDARRKRTRPGVPCGDETSFIVNLAPRINRRYEPRRVQSPAADRTADISRQRRSHAAYIEDRRRQSLALHAPALPWPRWVSTRKRRVWPRCG